MSDELILNNARVVLADEVILASVVVRNGVIADIGMPSTSGEDFGGDYLLPGLVELHTDALENHYKPRPRVRWSPVAAVQAHESGTTFLAHGCSVSVEAIGRLRLPVQAALYWPTQSEIERKSQRPASPPFSTRFASASMKMPICRRPT